MAAPSLLVCTVYAAPLRATASHRAEQVSQLLFGETAYLLEENEQGWCHIQCLWDGYEGWCCRSMLAGANANAAHHGGHMMVVNTKSFMQLEEGAEVMLPPGAMLWGSKSHAIDIGFTKGSFKGRRERINTLASRHPCPVEMALMYREAPYLWGGRTPAGIDCSGLIQMAFKLCGIALPRDAWQQAETGETVDFLQHAMRGDVAFFDNEEGRIVHVGILIDNSHILHATETSGRTVMDRIDGEGIISVQLRRRTHRLRLIRRFAASEIMVVSAAVQGALF